ncbi:hypothetical protein R3P38DRAFT_3450723 [Favolaschia claudopus]|uniref:AB hydrolase-1 domain-containing protein n=1 Tax=Favolaschia claudopus TaxID=2862362 RepID=A0AAV9ZM06_9AGAR
MSWLRPKIPSTGTRLRWMPCNTNFECARLRVSLDSKNPSSKTAAIALIHAPASLPTNSSAYCGPLIMGAGGPGGSGVDLILTYADFICGVVGPGFDLVGFDGRGISRSTWRANFFPTEAERAQFPADLSTPPQTPHLEHALEHEIRIGAAEGRFFNTGAPARDMLKIVEAHGREKVQYWGFSLITQQMLVLPGMTALTSDKFGRSSSTASWIRRIIMPVLSTQFSFVDDHPTKTWNLFLESCVSAGPSACALYESTPAAIQAKVNVLSQQLKTRPFPVVTSLSSFTPFYHVVDYSMLRQTIFVALYISYASFQPLASALHDLSLGNASALYEMSVLFAPPYRCPANAADAASEGWINVLDSQVAIQCNDGAVISSDYG